MENKNDRFDSSDTPGVDTGFFIDPTKSYHIRTPWPYTGRFRFRDGGGLLVLQVQVEKPPDVNFGYRMDEKVWRDATIEDLSELMFINLTKGE